MKSKIGSRMNDNSNALNKKTCTLYYYQGRETCAHPSCSHSIY